MAFFDKMGETISSKSKNIAAKAKELAEVTSLNGQVSSQEEVINHAYTEIGRAYYAAHFENPEEMYAENCNAIREANLKIEELKTQIRNIKGIQQCPNCGSDIPLNSAFCPNCGTKVEVPVQPEQESADVKICPNCGAALADDAMFCTECGSKLS